MKKQLLATSTAMLLALSLHTEVQAIGLAAGKPDLVLAPIQRSFIPQGFDNNDNAQVVVTGGYPNSCYHVGHTQYWIDRAAKKIDVEVTAYKTNNEVCLQVYVPFQQEISVGILDKGTYTVSVNQDTRNARTMTVRDAPTVSPDNHIYAPVTQIIRVGAREFLLRGTFHSSCMNMEEIKVAYEPGEVVAVLPMAGYDSSCFETGQARPWEARFQVKNDLAGDFLMHVRSLNGDALNSVQSFSPFDF
jgi:hypothetical protein